MMRRIATVLTLVLAAPQAASPAPAVTTRPSPPAAAPAPSPTPFAARLATELGKRAGNLVYSPASIGSALALLREGARGTTADELDHVIGADDRAFAAALATLAGRAATGKAVRPELSVANGIFADGALPLEPSFVDAMRATYRAAIQPVDFQRHAEAARAQINTWVAGATHDRIRDLLGAGAVGSETRAVLVDAIYLRAAWQTPFEVARTAPARFLVTGAAAKQVPTMHVDTVASSGAHAGARVLDLPYEQAGGPGLGMLLVVPDGKDLASVEAAYQHEGVAPFLASASERGQTEVSLPRFEASSDIELSGALQQLGVRRAFTGAAELTGMSPARLQVSGVVHKAWLKVDEAGTEAAAATGVIAMETAVIPQQKPFAVDRSFLFFVHDGDGHVLFAGRIVDPTAK